MAKLDDMIRGRVAAYGNIRGGQIGLGGDKSPRNRGKPAYPTGYAQDKANDQPDEGFQVQENTRVRLVSDPERGIGEVQDISPKMHADTRRIPVKFVDFWTRNGGDPRQVPTDWVPEDLLEPLAEIVGDEGYETLDSQMNPVKEGKWLRGLTAAGALAMASPASEYRPTVGMGDVAAASGKEVPEPKGLEDWISEASSETGIQPEFIRAIIRVESSGRHGQTSHKGAHGYMQLMPGTAAEVGVDPKNPRMNVIGGSRYLQRLAHRYNGNLAKTIGAYNAGPRKIAGKKIKHWPPETRNYIRKVLKELPRGTNLVSYKPIQKKQRPIVAQNEAPMVAAGTRGPTDLSGKKLDPSMEPQDPVSSLSDGLGRAIRSRLVETATGVAGVTVGRFQPFHAGHGQIIRQLAAQYPRVVIFVAGLGRDKKNPFDYQTRVRLIKASLPDLAGKIEVHPARLAGKGSGYVPGLIAQLGDIKDADILVGEDRISVVKRQIEHNEAHRNEPGYFAGRLNARALPGVSLDNDEAGRISGTRVRDALTGDDKDDVQKMLDPHVSSRPDEFEAIYAQLRRELDGSGVKTVDVIRDAVREAMIQEFTGMEFGNTRMGSHGWSAWSSGPAALAKNRSGDDPNANVEKPNRMLSLTNRGVPDDHRAGEELDHHIDDEVEELTDPTDLSDAIIRRARTLSRA